MNGVGSGEGRQGVDGNEWGVQISMAGTESAGLRAEMGG